MKRYAFSKTNLFDKTFLLILYLYLIIAGLIVLYPILWVISASFSDQNLVHQGKLWLFPVGINAKAYKQIFLNDNLILGYRNSLFYMVIGTFINLFMTTIAAYPLSRKDFVGRDVIMLLLSFTMWFSGGLIPTYLVIKKLNMLNTIWVILVPGAISVWNMIIMRNYFQTNIPGELYEAAIIDGCGNLEYLFKVVIKLSGPIIAVMIIFYGVGRWNDYFQAMIYISNRDLYPLQLFLREILIQSQMTAMQQNVISDSTMQEMVMLADGIKYAVVVVSSIPVMILYPWVQKYMMKGIMVGAIKG